MQKATKWLLIFGIFIVFGIFLSSSSMVLAKSIDYNATIDDVDLGMAKEGYSYLDDRFLRLPVISNTGTMNFELSGAYSKVELTGEGAENFVCGWNSGGGDIYPGESKESKAWVRPAPDLTAGTYTATLVLYSSDVSEEFEFIDDCTVTFRVSTNDVYMLTLDSNNESEETAVLFAEVNPSYHIPECPFDAPEGMVFGGWKINDTTYIANQVFDLHEDVTLVAQWKMLISEVSLEGVQMPLIGALPTEVANITVPQDANYTITNAYWFNETTGLYMTANEEFTLGSSYHLEVILAPSEGYVFAPLAAMEATLSDIMGAAYTTSIFTAGTGNNSRAIYYKITMPSTSTSILIDKDEVDFGYMKKDFSADDSNTVIQTIRVMNNGSTTISISDSNPYQDGPFGTYWFTPGPYEPGEYVDITLRLAEGSGFSGTAGEYYGTYVFTATNTSDNTDTASANVDAHVILTDIEVGIAKSAAQMSGTTYATIDDEFLKVDFTYSDSIVNNYSEVSALVDEFVVYRRLSANSIAILGSLLTTDLYEASIVMEKDDTFLHVQGDVLSGDIDLNNLSDPLAVPYSYYSIVQVGASVNVSDEIEFDDWAVSGYKGLEFGTYTVGDRIYIDDTLRIVYIVTIADVDEKDTINSDGTVTWFDDIGGPDEPEETTGIYAVTSDGVWITTDSETDEFCLHIRLTNAEGENTYSFASKYSWNSFYDTPIDGGSVYENGNGVFVWARMNSEGYITDISILEEGLSGNSAPFTYDDDYAFSNINSQYGGDGLISTNNGYFGVTDDTVVYVLTPQEDEGNVIGFTFETLNGTSEELEGIESGLVAYPSSGSAPASYIFITKEAEEVFTEIGKVTTVFMHRGIPYVCLDGAGQANANEVDLDNEKSIASTYAELQELMDSMVVYQRVGRKIVIIGSLKNTDLFGKLIVMFKEDSIIELGDGNTALDIDLEDDDDATVIQYASYTIAQVTAIVNSNNEIEFDEGNIVGKGLPFGTFRKGDRVLFDDTLKIIYIVSIEGADEADIINADGTVTFDEEPIDVLIGDYTEDGELNILDVRLLLQTTLTIDVPTEEDIDKYDLTGDGYINILDVRLLLQMVLGNTPSE